MVYDGTMLNIYDATYNPGGVKHTVAASSMEEAAKVLHQNYGGQHGDPVLLQRVQDAVSVKTPDIQIAFETKISPAEAETANCIATPTQYVVAGGTSLLFEAIPATGWLFSKWSINGMDVPGDAKAILTIPSNQAQAQVVATFAPKP